MSEPRDLSNGSLSHCNTSRLIHHIDPYIDHMKDPYCKSCQTVHARNPVFILALVGVTDVLCPSERLPADSDPWSGSAPSSFESSHMFRQAKLRHHERSMLREVSGICFVPVLWLGVGHEVTGEKYMLYFSLGSHAT